MAKHHAGSSAVLSSGPAVQLRPHNFVVTCIASQRNFALVLPQLAFLGILVLPQLALFTDINFAQRFQGSNYQIM